MIAAPVGRRFPPWEGWLAGGAALGAAVTLGSLPVAVGLPLMLFMAALVAGLRNPVWPLALVALAVPFGSEVPLSLGGLGGATDVAIAGAVGVWAVQFLAQRGGRLRFPVAWLPVLLFVSALALAVTVASAMTASLKELVKWLEFGLLAVAAAHTLHTERNRTILVAAVLLAAGLEAAVGWYQFMNRTGPEWFFLQGGLLRAYGTFGQPNPFAGYLALTLPLAVSFFLGRPGRWQFPAPPVLIGLAVAGALIAGGIGMSFSRGGWLAAAAALAVVLALHSRWARVGLALGVVSLILLGVTGAAEALPPQITGRLQVVTRYVSLFDARYAIVTPENYAIVERMAIWQAAWAMFTDHPLLGVGAGNFDVVYRDYALRGWTSPPGHAHNAYLTMLAEVGIVGAVAHVLMLLGLFLMVAAAVWRFRREGGPSDAYPLALGALGMLAALSTHNLLDNLYVHGIPAHIGLIVGAVAAALAQGRSPQSSP